MIYPINSLTTYRQNSVYRQQTNFKGILDKCTQKACKKFVVQSRQHRMPIDQELKNYLKIVKLKYGKEIYEAFDINPDNAKEYIVFYHGLGQNITSNQHFYKSVIKKGYGILAVEHSGFGNSNGQLSAKSVKNNSKAIMQYFKEKQIPLRNVGVVSHSLGSFPATDLAHRSNEFKFVILIAPFNSLKKEKDFLLRPTSKLPQIFKFLIKKFPFILNAFDKRFKIASRLKKIESPIYLIHSADDRTISIKSTEELAKKTTNLKNFVILDSGKHGLNQEKIKIFESLI